MLGVVKQPTALCKPTHCSVLELGKIKNYKGFDKKKKKKKKKQPQKTTLQKTKSTAIYRRHAKQTSSVLTPVLCP
jgi:hypothetical protein